MQSPAVSASKKSTQPWRPTLQSKTGTPPWHSQHALNTSDESTISRDEFLAGRVLSKKNSEAHLPGAYSLGTQSTTGASPAVRPALPPGLAPPPGLERPGDRVSSSDEASAQKSQKPKKQPVREKPKKQPVHEKPKKQPVHEVAPVPEKPEKQPVLDSSPPESNEYKVFLQNMPESMLKESFLRAMLDQANLSDITKLAFRPNGKVLITFTSYASVHKCVNHFHGRKWGNSSLPVSAVYVYSAPQHETQKRQPEAAAKQAPWLKINAPAFVPGSFSKMLSANAPAFVPSGVPEKQRDRSMSDASTDAGRRSRQTSSMSTQISTSEEASELSEACYSETEEQAQAVWA